MQFNTLKIEGILPEELILENRNGALLFIDSVSGHAVFLQNFFSGAAHQIDYVQFDNGVTWDKATLLGKEIGHYGTAGGESITLRNGGPNVAYGYAGNDTINGGNGDDRIYGGTGNDTIYGGAGNDTYVFKRGDGFDFINVNDATVGRIETLKIEGILPEELILENRNGALLFIDSVSGHAVFLQNFFSGSAHQIDYVQFDNGVTWDKATLLGKEISQYGTAGNDTITVRSGGPNSAYGQDGNDTLNGVEGSDRLFGGNGVDTLNGNAGDDTLDGGTGNDILNGGAGNDSYILGLGYGSDTIQESDATVGNADVARFTSGIATDQLWFRQVGNNLEVSIIGTSDKFTIQNWYSAAANHVEQFRTADNKVLLDSQVENLVQAMAAFAPPSAGQTTLPQSYQDQLAPVLAANWQ